MVRHVDLQSFPSDYISHRLVKLAKEGRLPTRRVSSLSLRPTAVWELMYAHLFGYELEAFMICVNRRLQYLQLFDLQDMCVQLPIMDDNIHRSMLKNRSNGQDNTNYRNGLKDLREALSAPLFAFDRGLDRYFDLFAVTCRHLTIHNLVMISCDRACRSINPATKTVQAIFRPCAGADGDLQNKTEAAYCINHPVSGNLDITNGEFRMNHEVLSSPQQVDFVDMDWVRGNLDPYRSSDALNAVRAQLDLQMQEYSGEETKTWGKKSLKTSNEVEACRCCNKVQLTATEVSVSLYSCGPSRFELNL